MECPFSGCLHPNFKHRFQSVKEVLKYLPQVKPVLVEREYQPPQIVQGFCVRVMQGEEYGKVYLLSDLVNKGTRLFTIGRERDNVLTILENRVRMYLAIIARWKLTHLETSGLFAMVNGEKKNRFGRIRATVHM